MPVWWRRLRGGAGGTPAPPAGKEVRHIEEQAICTAQHHLVCLVRPVTAIQATSKASIYHMEEVEA